MLEIFILLFAAGLLAKLADILSDTRKKTLRNYAKHVIGLLYGLISGYVIISYPELAPLGIAIMLSVMFTEKIDHPVHFLGIGSSIFVFCLLGFPQIGLIPLAFFLLGGIIDEAGNNLSDRGKIGGLAGRFLRYRLTLEIFTFVFSALTGAWVVFLSMLCFDAGYMVSYKILGPALGRKKRKKQFKYRGKRRRKKIL